MIFYCDTWRHLICVPYSVENLHKMAEILDIKRCWYDPKPHAHYDIPKRRYDEIRAKCTLIPAVELLKLIISEKERANSQKSE